jgi:hypothetical protein
LGGDKQLEGGAASTRSRLLIYRVYKEVDQKLANLRFIHKVVNSLFRAIAAKCVVLKQALRALSLSNPPAAWRE